MVKRKAALPKKDRASHSNKRQRDEKSTAEEKEAEAHSSCDESGDEDFGGIPLTGISDDSGESNDSGSDGEREDKDDNAPIEITFEFKDPCEEYYHAIKTMLSSFLIDGCLNRSQVAETLVAKPEVGTIVVQEECTDVFGFISALHLGPHQESPIFEEIKTYLLSKCDTDSFPKLSALLQRQGSGLGIIVSERMLNLPPQLVPQMHQSLLSDIAWAQENAENESEEADVKFENLIILAPCSMVSPSSKAATYASKSKTPDASARLPSDVYFDRFDDEYACEGAHLSFMFQATPSTPGAPSKPFLLSVLNYRQYEENVSRLGDVFS